MTAAPRPGDAVPAPRTLITGTPARAVPDPDGVSPTLRLGVLDVGSNTVHLLVVDARHGGAPVPQASVKDELRLAELLDAEGALTPRGADALVATVAHAAAEAERLDVDDLVAFATSAVRDATNSPEVLARVRAETGVELNVLSGADEARLTFLAVRRWLGWSAGRLLSFDIGGGSLEVAYGADEEPSLAVSLPLGAGRLTRDRLPGDPPRSKDVAATRKYVRAEVAGLLPLLAKHPDPDRVVATSKTFRSLARLAGAAPSAQGPRVRRVLTRNGIDQVLGMIGGMTAAQRARLDGVSPGRARQLLAGAMVAEAVLDLLDLPELEICPWALREGLILRRLDWLASG
ncbi:MAG TPA: hypothetical protein VGD03_10850 [Frankiaceae bacterium]